MSLPDRLLAPAVDVLSRVLVLDPEDQLDVMAYVAAAWCFSRDRTAGRKRNGRAEQP